MLFRTEVIPLPRTNSCALSRNLFNCLAFRRYDACEFNIFLQ